MHNTKESGYKGIEVVQNIHYIRKEIIMEIISHIRHGNEEQYTADTGDVIIFTDGVVTWCSFPERSNDFYEIYDAVMRFDAEHKLELV